MPKRTCGSHATLDLWLNIEVIDHALSWARQQHHSVIHTATNTNNPYATACFWFCPCCIEKLYTLPCNQPFTPISSIRSIARSACCIFLHFLPVAMEASLALIHVPTIPLQGKAWSWMVIFSARRAMQRSAFSTTRRWCKGGNRDGSAQPIIRAACLFLAWVGQAGGPCARSHVLRWGWHPSPPWSTRAPLCPTIRCVDGDGVVSMT